MCHIKWAFLALLLWPGNSPAQDPKNKAHLNPNEVEIRLSDGSRVRMLILQESLDIETKYGKLTTPISDLRRIEFGIRPAVAKKVDEAVERLGHKSFQERDQAMKELVATGAPAYVALHKAAKSKDAEVAQRANKALEQIRQKVPENKLRVRSEDVIQTAQFTIVGRVLTHTIKARSAIFGETQLNVLDLHGIHWLGQVAEVELEMEGAKYAVNATQWMDTGIELTMDEELVISAYGKVDLMPNGGGQGLSGPEGNAQFQGGPQGAHPPGALLGRIGENGQVFLIGANYAGASKTEGKLYLQISTSPWARHGGNTVTGSYKVKVTGGRDTQDR
jgi:hypothetical protein